MNNPKDNWRRRDHVRHRLLPASRKVTSPLGTRAITAAVAITATPAGLSRTASSSRPVRTAPIERVVPHNGQGTPVTILNRHRVGPPVKPLRRLDRIPTPAIETTKTISLAVAGQAESRINKFNAATSQSRRLPPRIVPSKPRHPPRLPQLKSQVQRSQGLGLLDSDPLRSDSSPRD
jgi:hypothetical protein